jgi:hypothetical protein
MHHFKRLALGAVVAGTLIGGLPAVASAATTTCSYDPTSGGVVDIKDNSGSQVLRIRVTGTFITVDDANANPILCSGDGTLALTTNTSLIRVSSSLGNPNDGYILDQSEGVFGPGAKPELDGNSELETTISNSGVKGRLQVIGSTAHDVMKVGGTFGQVGLGSDNDIDVLVSTGSNSVELDGGAGPDTLTGRGNGNFAPFGPTNVRLFVQGGAGDDEIYGGNAPNDSLDGNNDNDFLNSADGTKSDTVLGGFGDDTAVVDTTEASFNSLEHVTFGGPVGRLKLMPSTLKAEAGMIARLKLSWTTPKAWRDLRKVQLRLYDGKQAVGMINVRPGSERVTGRGAVAVMAGSKLSHHGKTVVAKLAFDVAKSMAGKDLRVDVKAGDSHGHRQYERAAGTIQVR